MTLYRTGTTHHTTLANLPELLENIPPGTDIFFPLNNNTPIDNVNQKELIVPIDLKSNPNLDISFVGVMEQLEREKKIPKPPKICENPSCGKRATRTCSGCKAVRYCNAECQRTHRSEHKGDCSVEMGYSRRLQSIRTVFHFMT